MIHVVTSEALTFDLLQLSPSFVSSSDPPSTTGNSSSGSSLGGAGGDDSGASGKKKLGMSTFTLNDTRKPGSEPAYDLRYRYRVTYQDRLIRGMDSSVRPWNIYDVTRDKISGEAVVADVGCGSAYKSLQLARSVRLLIGVEPNEEMIHRAVQNAREKKVGNACFVKGSYEHLPFDDGSIDLVVGFLAPHDTSEIYRVLKRGGWAVVERVGDRDKVNIKEIFGEDENGPRGQLMTMQAGERARLFESEFQRMFTRVETRNGFWDTEYTLEELLMLLKHTPTIRNFSLETDAMFIDRIQSDLMRNGKIRTTQNRVLVVAQK